MILHANSLSLSLSLSLSFSLSLCSGILHLSWLSLTRQHCRMWTRSIWDTNRPLGRTPVERFIPICPRMLVFVCATFYRPATSILLTGTFMYFQNWRASAIRRTSSWKFMSTLSYTMEAAQIGSIWQQLILPCIREMWTPHLKRQSL